MVEDDGHLACKVCKRTNSVATNRIVICDKCGTPYHQLCHNPPVDRVMVEVADTRWFCRNCDNGDRDVQPLQTGVCARDIEPHIRKAYLTTLPKAQLMTLIQYAETLHPDLPLYSPRTQEIVKQMQLENARNKRNSTNSGYVNYEDILVEILKGFPNGLEVSDIWQEVQRKQKTPVEAAFKHSASRALQRILRKGRVKMADGRFFFNPEYQPGNDQNLLGILQNDDSYVFSAQPMRLPLFAEDLVLDQSDAFSHTVYT